MKLARPNVFHPRIVLASCRQHLDGDGDDDGLVAALRRRGLHARWMSWDDPQTETADLVILRAAWDYAERRAEFLAWTARVRNLLNPAALVAWNSDKHYLQDLAAAGVPTMASFFLEPGQAPAFPRAVRGAEVVVKPAVGAGSIDTFRFADQAAAVEHAAAMLDRGRSVLVQPYDARVEDGETALVFIGGEQSHAFTKGPILPPEGRRPDLDESGTFARETLTPADPDFELWDLGHAALDVACARAGMAKADLLYARVDLIGGSQDPVLLELELIEPSLGWRQLDARTRELQQRRFALGVESACERLGLGPLSHRRP
jgi:glutathione synthase/RimK-type ligase-like ATP-grasp enzyme